MGFDPTRSGIHPTVHKPALAKCSPERESLGREQARWFREWCLQNHISIRDLAAILQVNISVAEKKLSAKSPITEIDIAMFPERQQADLRFGLQDCSRTHLRLLRAHG